MNMRKFTTRYAFFVLIAAVFTFSIIINVLLAPYKRSIDIPHYFDSVVQLICPDDTSCYDYSRNTSLGAEKFPENSIYFHETSCRKILTLRKACSIQAAARTHPNRKVIVILTTATKNYLGYRDIVTELQKISNVQINRIQILSYLKGTPFEKHRNIKRIRKNKVIGEILKLVTLFKYGGTVLDLEMILAKPLDVLGHNWVVKETEETIGSAVLSAGKSDEGTKVIGAILNSLSNQRWLDERSSLRILTETFKHLCSTNLNNLTEKPCHGFHIYDTDHFYPITRERLSSYFHPGKLQDTYGYYLWNLNFLRSVPMNALFVKITDKHCPIICNKFIFRYLE